MAHILSPLSSSSLYPPDITTEYAPCFPPEIPAVIAVCTLAFAHSSLIVRSLISKSGRSRCQCRSPRSPRRANFDSRDFAKLALVPIVFRVSFYQRSFPGCDIERSIEKKGYGVVIEILTNPLCPPAAGTKSGWGVWGETVSRV